MRISDWSSDVCSSDLNRDQEENRDTDIDPAFGTKPKQLGTMLCGFGMACREQIESSCLCAHRPDPNSHRPGSRRPWPDRKRVVKGKSVSVSVDIGGRRIMKKKTKKSPK